MNRLSRLLVLASLLIAAWVELWLGARELGELLRMCEVAFGAALIAALFRRRATMAASLAVAYLTPLLFTIIVGRFRSHYVLVWIALLLGGMTASSPFRGWAIPLRWRWPLV